MSSDLSISGLASGVNTADIVDKLMSLERQPLTQMQTRESNLEKQQSAWRDLNTQLLSLSSKLEALQTAGTFTSQSTKSSDETVVSAVAGSGAVSGTYNIQVAKLAQADSVVATVAVSDATKDLGSQVAGFQAGRITVGGTAIDVLSSDTLNSLAGKINKAQSNVVATVINNRLVFTAGKTGLANQLVQNTAVGTGLMNLADGDSDIATTDSNLLQQLGVINGGNFNQYLTHANDADLFINGIEVQSGSNTLSSAVNGLEITVKAVSQTVASTGDPTKDLKGTSLQVSTDTQKAVSAVKAFVDQYNSVMNFINDKTSYNKTSKTQGALYADSAVLQLQQKLRQMVGSVVPGAIAGYTTLAQVGISTSGRETTLSFDSTKLTTVLNSNPDAVTALFGTKQSGAGIASTMTNLLTAHTQYGTGMIATRNASLDRQIKYLKDRMDDFQTRLDMRQQTLTNQFNAMEQAISNFKSQGTALTNLFAQTSSSS